MKIEDTQLLIVSREFAYVVEDSKTSGAMIGRGLVALAGEIAAKRKHGCHFIIRDDVKFEQYKAKLLIVDADGKECKLDIQRQERLPASIP